MSTFYYNLFSKIYNRLMMVVDFVFPNNVMLVNAAAAATRGAETVVATNNHARRGMRLF
jgi:hypothetical protein